MNLDNFFRQPSNIHALGVILGGASAALAHFVTGNPTVDGIFGIIAYVGTHLAINDNSAPEVAAERATKAALAGKTPSLDDLKEIVQSFLKQTPPEQQTPAPKPPAS